MGKKMEKVICRQRVDKTLLKIMIDNYEELKPKLTADTGGLTKLKTYYNSLDDNGEVVVSYSRTKNNFNRKYGDKINLTSISRIERHTIARDYQIDIDMVNCHPTLLLGYCRKNDIPCPKLAFYVENRTSILNIDPSMKQEMIRIMNGGKPTLKNEFALEFYEEIKGIYGQLNLNNGGPGAEPPLWNRDGKLLNLRLIELEDRALTAMIDYLGDEGVEISSLAFDGLTIPRTVENEERLPELLAGCSKAIETVLGIKIQVIEKPMNFGIDMSGIVNHPETLGTHFVDDFLTQEEYLAIVADGDIVIDRRSTGCGKSTNAINELRKSDSFAVVHHRMSLDEDNVKRYEDIKSYKDPNCGNKVSVVINSFTKTVANNFGGNIHNVGGLVIDEFRSVLRQCDMSSMGRDDVSMLLDLLQYYGREGTPSAGKKLTILDANITKEDIEYIQTLRPGVRTVILADKTNTPKFKAVVFNGDDTDLTSALLRHNFKDCKVVLAYSSNTTKCEGMLKYVSELTGATYVNIHRETRKTIDYSTLNEMDIIAYSPTISEGVSFDESVFNNRVGFGLFATASAGAETCSQMMRRFRGVIHHTVFIYGGENKARFNTNEEYLEYAGKNLSELSALVSTSRDYCPETFQSRFTIKKDELWNLHVKNRLEDEYARANFRQVFIQKLVNNKFEVDNRLNEAPREPEVIEELEIAMDNAVVERYTTMTGVRVIDETTYEVLRSNQKTVEDALVLEKHRIMKGAGLVEATSDNLRYFDRRIAPVCRLRGIIKYNGDRVSTGEILNGRLLREAAEFNAYNFWDEKKYLKIPVVFDFKNFEIIRTLGWTNLGDLTPLQSLNLVEVRKLLTFKYCNHLAYLAWERPFNKTSYNERFKNDDATLGYINSLLRTLGLRIIKYKDTYYQVCNLRNMKLGVRGDPTLGAATPYALEDEKEEKTWDFFFWAMNIEEQKCGVVIPNYRAETHQSKCVNCRRLKAPVITYNCGKCSKYFGNRKTDWTRHEKSCGVLKVRKEYACDKCHRTFGGRKADLTRHQEICN